MQTIYPHSDHYPLYPEMFHKDFYFTDIVGTTQELQLMVSTWIWIKSKRHTQKGWMPSMKIIKLLGIWGGGGV